MNKVFCEVCKGSGYITIIPGGSKGIRLCPFCKGTGNNVNNVKGQDTSSEPDLADSPKPDLTADEYQKMASRTIDLNLKSTDQELHAIFGMSSEVGEVHSIYQKAYQGHNFDPEEVKKEIGDLLWFVSEYCTARGWKLSDVMNDNIKKLEARYPDGFSSERSVNREEYSKKKELTYGDIFSNCLEDHPHIKNNVSDYRPFTSIYGGTNIENAIVVWLTNGQILWYQYDGTTSASYYI